MKLAALVVVAFLFAVTGDARAGGKVDWSEYLDDGSKLPASKTPEVAVADDEPAAAPAKEKATKATKRTAAKAKKGKTSKAKAAKAKTRAKAKKRRR